MAVNTDRKLQNQVIYSVYVRNHTPEGTFRAVIPDLDRIKSLGTDIIWFMPIHPIGLKGRKGSLGCPYANRDYRDVNPEYGSMADFMELVSARHARGMKCMIDVVYNHTSPDTVLYSEHPEFFYHGPDGKPGNKIGDWSDVIDLDYNNRALWDYQIASLKMWASLVDGFRCDVASFVPVEFWQKAREEVSPRQPRLHMALPRRCTRATVAEPAGLAYTLRLIMMSIPPLISSTTMTRARASINICAARLPSRTISIC